MNAPESNEQRGPIARAVMATLDRFGYKHIINRKGTSILFDAVTEGPTKWRSRCAIFEDSRVLAIESFITDSLYNPSRRPWVLELVCRFNVAFPTGAYVFSWDGGWVQYRTHVSFGTSDVTEAKVEAALNSISYPLQVWEAAFAHRHSKTSPSAALDAALLKLDGFEGIASQSALRALLTISSHAPLPMQDGENASGARPNLLLL